MLRIELLSEQTTKSIRSKLLCHIAHLHLLLKEYNEGINIIIHVHVYMFIIIIIYLYNIIIIYYNVYYNYEQALFYSV